MKLSTLAALAVGLSTGVVGLASNPDYALDVSDNGRYFVSKSTSEPFFWQADTIWTLFHRYNLTEVEIYLDDRAKKGYTMLLTVALVMFGAENPNRNGDLPLIDYDVARPNEAYWAHVDTVYEMAWERGIRIAFVPSWGYYIHDSDNTRGFGNVTIDESNGYAFGKWFGERYPDSPFLLVGDTNNCWTDKGAVSGNYSRGGIPPASATQFTDYTPVYDAMARGLQDGSGHHDKTLITGHPTNQWFTGCPLAVSSDMFPQSQWLTFDACQSGHADYPPNPPIPWWNARRGWEPIEYMYNQPQARPVLDNEPHYENRFNNGKPGRPAWNASDIRRGSYQAVFSGAAGVVYGNDNIMQGYIPGLFDHSGSGPANSWADDLHLAGSQQVSLVQKVFKDRESLWPNYVPDSSFLIPPEGSLDSLGRDDNRTMGVRASDNSAIMVYTPLGGDVWVDWSCVDVGPSGNVLAQWFDPVEGGYTAAKVPAQSPGNFNTPASDSHSDWVLVVEQGQA